MAGDERTPNMSAEAKRRSSFAGGSDLKRISLSSDDGAAARHGVVFAAGTSEALPRRKSVAPPAGMGSTQAMRRRSTINIQQSLDAFKEKMVISIYSSINAMTERKPTLKF